MISLFLSSEYLYDIFRRDTIRTFDELNNKQRNLLTNDNKQSTINNSHLYLYILTSRFSFLSHLSFTASLYFIICIITCHALSRQWLVKPLISIRSSDLTMQSFLTRDFLLRISRTNSTKIVISLYTSWLHSLHARLTFFYHTIVHQSHSINSSQSIRAIVR